MWTLAAKRGFLLLAVILGLGQSVRADQIQAALPLPPAGAPGFNELCREMYTKRDTPEGWPIQYRGSNHHCTLRTRDGSETDMSADDYAWTLRKSLTFACKGKREVIYEVVRRLKDCDGGKRTIEMRPVAVPKRGCQVSFGETSEAFSVAPPLIDELIDWRENMPWYERILVNLFAPRELPMVMDGLIGCGATLRPRP